MASIMPCYNDSAILPESSRSTPGSASIPHPFLSQRQVRPGTDASKREIRRATAAYYGMVETIDSHYREVLDALMHVGKIWTSGLLSIPLIMAKCWENMAFGKNKSFSKRVSVFR